MQISAPLNTAIAQLPNQRRDVAEERGQKNLPRELETNDPDQIGSPFRSNADDLTSRSVESSRQVSNIFSRKSSEGKDFPLNTRKALQSFAENTPSAQQQLGVELAGINTFA